MTPQELSEFLDAAHLTSFVESPYDSRGGIMLVGPAGSLKSTILKRCFDYYPQALVLSDLNINTLTKMRDELVSGRYSTFCFEELEKLYQRKSDTASNIEGVLKALADQGFLHPSFQDQRMVGLCARALVVGAMTYSFYARKFTEWRDSGFARRFLWVVFRTSNYSIIGDAIERRVLISVDGIQRAWPRNKKIPFDLTDSQATTLRKFLKDQTDESTTQVLMQKIFCVLNWKYANQPGKAMDIINAVAPCLSKNGGELVLTI